MGGKGDILLHTCCAVCFEAVFDALVEDGRAVTAFFYNPNIHPYREFQKRLRAVEVATGARKVRLIADRRYGLQAYLDDILPAGGGRCRACYRLRLREAARVAAARGIGAFTTTLLASPHQKHDEVAAEGRSAAEEAGLEFFYCDWRGRMPMGVESAHRKSLYRQHYCGCIWSEYERFHHTGQRAGE